MTKDFVEGKMDNTFNVDMTFAQLIEKTAVCHRDLLINIKHLQCDIQFATQAREIAEDSYHKNETPQTASALDEAECNYWDLQDKLDDLNDELSYIEEMKAFLRNVPDCRDLKQLAYAFNSAL
jgi:predicted nuclease with TOPRIM domain